MPRVALRSKVTFFSGWISDHFPLVLDVPSIIGVVDLYCVNLAKKLHFPVFLSLHNSKSLGLQEAFCRGCDRWKWSSSHIICTHVSVGQEVLLEPTTCCHMLYLICWLTSSSSCISSFSFSGSWARHVLSSLWGRAPTFPPGYLHCHSRILEAVTVCSGYQCFLLILTGFSFSLLPPFYIFSLPDSLSAGSGSSARAGGIASYRRLNLLH